MSDKNRDTLSKRVARREREVGSLRASAPRSDRELAEGIEVAGVSIYLQEARYSGITLFI